MAPPFLRTLSARILVGFALLIATFGATMVWIVAYMNDLRSESEVIRTRYLRLTIVAKDLAGQQQLLVSYLREEMAGDTPAVVARRLQGIREGRRDMLERLETTLDGMRDLPRGHGTVVIRYLDRVHGMQRSIAQLEDSYREVISSASDHGNAARPIDAGRVRDRLMSAESGLLTSTRDLADQLRVRTERIVGNLEYNAHRLRWFTGAMGVLAVLAGLLVTVWVTITLRPLARLRDGARRIAAGDYGSRVEEKGPAEVSELAGEFNAMGRAIEERERELVRSERLAAVGKMAAMITHEVRNPLSSIGLNAELLEDELGQIEGPAGEEARAICRSITREVDRLTAITEEYLAFARLPRPRPAPGSVAALVDDLGRFVGGDLASRGVELDIEHDGGHDRPARPAIIDDGQLRQALLNLVRNAAEAVVGQDGGRVRLATRSTESHVEIEVADNGPGIPDDVRERLFDPFFSTKDGGTGLGLALTHQIVRDHGGEIRVTSSPDGACFTIRLPVAPATAAV